MRGLTNIRHATTKPFDSHSCASQPIQWFPHAPRRLLLALCQALRSGSSSGSIRQPANELDKLRCMSYTRQTVKQEKLKERLNHRSAAHDAPCCKMSQPQNLPRLLENKHEPSAGRHTCSSHQQRRTAAMLAGHSGELLDRGEELARARSSTAAMVGQRALVSLLLTPPWRGRCSRSASNNRVIFYILGGDVHHVHTRAKFLSWCSHRTPKFLFPSPQADARFFLSGHFLIVAFAGQRARSTKIRQSAGQVLTSHRGRKVSSRKNPSEKIHSRQHWQDICEVLKVYCKSTAKVPVICTRGPHRRCTHAITRFISGEREGERNNVHAVG